MLFEKCSRLYFYIDVNESPVVLQGQVWKERHNFLQNGNNGIDNQQFYFG